MEDKNRVEPSPAQPRGSVWGASRLGARISRDPSPLPPQVETLVGLGNRGLPTRSVMIKISTDSGPFPCPGLMMNARARITTAFSESQAQIQHIAFSWFRHHCHLYFTHFFHRLAPRSLGATSQISVLRIFPQDVKGKRPSATFSRATKSLCASHRPDATPNSHCAHSLGSVMPLWP